MCLLVKRSKKKQQQQKHDVCSLSLDLCKWFNFTVIFLKVRFHVLVPN